MSHYHTYHSETCRKFNADIYQALLQLQEQDYSQRSHFFHGRYENLYLAVEKLPGLQVVLDTAKTQAADYLHMPPEQLTMGFWINMMAPGDVTTAHTHDDDDELLSGVYYIRVPADSGQLVISDAGQREYIQPQEGMFVFFSPQTLHEVTRNASDSIRVSVAFNFGPLSRDDE